MVNKQQLVEKITELVKNYEINGIIYLRDESNHLGIRIVIELKRGIIPEILLNNLFKMTKLQTNFVVNMVAIVGVEPKMLNIKSALHIYLDHQTNVLVRKTKFNLKIAQNRLHIFNGLMLALKNIDAIIKLIRNAENDKIILES
jgi:DNA gyrase subunit A